MTVFNTIFRLCCCLVAAWVVADNNADAFTIPAPVVIVDVPMAPTGNQDFIIASSSSSSLSSSSSNLPSQRQLLDQVSSFTIAAVTAETPPKATTVPDVVAPNKAPAVAVAAAVPKTTPAASSTVSKTATNAANTNKGINIAEIFFDGKVPKTESDEYVIIQNSSSKDTINVSGYSVYPATSGNQGSTFVFPKGSTIKPNSSVRIYTNEIHKETGGYSWGSGRALWSNKGGLGVLKDNNGKKLGEYKY